MSETTTDSGLASRRAVLAGAAGVGVAAALAACGNSTPSTGSGRGSGEINNSAIQADGGRVHADRRVVVTQRTAGSFKAFDAVCTHQGCILASVSGGTINCDCHGSKYSIADGSVKEAANGDKNNTIGQKGLAEKTVTI